MRIGFWLASAVSILCTAPQLSAKNANTPTSVQQFDEVERGFWIRLNPGLAFALSSVFPEDREVKKWPPGPMMAIEAGVDLGQYASLHIGFLASVVTGNRTLIDRSVSNDAGLYTLLAGLRYNFVTTKRLAYFLKLGGGWMMAMPDLAEVTSGVVLNAALGFEYATMLRHFFIGLEIGGSYDLANEGILAAVTPTLKYTF